MNAVDISTLDYRWGCTLSSGYPVPPPGQNNPPRGEQYLGAWVLWVPSDAKGTFSIYPKAYPESNLLNPDSQFMPLVGLNPGIITVEVGQCCFGLGTGDRDGCIDEITVGQCADAGLCHGECSEDGTTPCMTDDECTGTCSGVCNTAPWRVIEGSADTCYSDVDCAAFTCSADSAPCDPLAGAFEDVDCTPGLCWDGTTPCDSRWDCWGVGYGICTGGLYGCYLNFDCPGNETCEGAPGICSNVCMGGEVCVFVAGDICLLDNGMDCPAGMDCIVQGDYAFFPGHDCSEPCIQCPSPGPNDPLCGDGDACTVDVCTEYLTCSHTPVTITPNECCDPTCTISDAADLGGLGTIVSNVDDDQCTDNLCTPGSGCAVAPLCGVPYNPLSAYGTECDDWNHCTYNDICDGENPSGCAGLDVNAVNCTTSAICKSKTGVSFDCVDGYCHCVYETLYQKCRYISLLPQNLGADSAIRVTFMDLPDPYNVWNGVQMWVRPPAEYCQNSGQVTSPPEGCGSSPGLAPTFLASSLQCEPYYADWNTTRALHLYHEGIVPAAVYEVQAIEIGLDTSVEENYTAPLELTTSIWGDVVKDCMTQPCGPPDGVVNKTTDVTAFVDKFKNLPIAMMQVRTNLVSADCSAVLDQMTTVSEFVYALEAFRGHAYPFSPGPLPCP